MNQVQASTHVLQVIAHGLEDIRWVLEGVGMIVIGAWLGKRLGRYIAATTNLDWNDVER